MLPHERSTNPRRLAGLRLSAVALAVLAGCSNLPPAERQALQEATRLYERGDCNTPIPTIERLIRDYGRAEEIAEAYYLRGLCRTRSGQISGAVADFEFAVARSKRPELTARARASLASIRHQQGDWTVAAELYSMAVSGLPDQPPTDEILLGAGTTMQRAGRWREAAFQFARILRSFRDRPAAAEARRLAAWPHEYFSIQVAAFASATAAARTAQAWRSKGSEALYESIPREGSTLWVVMVGQYPTYSQAVKDLPRIRQSEAGAFIIP